MGAAADALGLGGASSNYTLGLYTAVMDGLAPDLAEAIIWLLNGRKAIPLLRLIGEEQKKDRVYASQA